MWNVDVLYDEIRNREFLLLESKLRHTVVYKNDKLYLHLKYSDYNETQLIMIKSCAPDSDDISYKVCVGKTNALDYIKLMQNTLRIQYNLDNINEDNTEDSDEISDIKYTGNTQFGSDNFPVLDTFEIIGGNTDELYEFLEYFVEGTQSPYSINSVYGDKDVVYYSSSYEYLGTLLSDIRDSIKLNTEKKQMFQCTRLSV